MLAQTIQSGIALMTWEQDSFAYAEGYDEGYDEATNRYQGLRAMQQVSVTPDAPGLVVRPARARQQLDVEGSSRPQAFTDQVNRLIQARGSKRFPSRTRDW